MSTPQIPNLNTLRKGGIRSRGRGGITGGGSRKSGDHIIQETDHDAASSRLSAVAAGYIDDPFTRLLTAAPLQRRLPLMNRGTYVRTAGIDRVVKTFLAAQSGRKQIISVGAGSDSRYFRLKREDHDLDMVYHEIDFEANTKNKIERIKDVEFAKAARELCGIDVEQFQAKDGHLGSEQYYIHAQDLRHLPATLPGVDVNLPTLLVSECCLIYLLPDEAEAVLEYFVQRFSNTPLAITIYEPIRPNDAFGMTMVRNLVQRGIVLQTLQKYADLDQQRERLQKHGFQSHAQDTYLIWQLWVEDTDKERIDHLEWMDEVEEFVLLAKHYCITYGWKGWSQESRWHELMNR